MLFSTLIPFTLISLAAAQKDDVVAGTVYSKINYSGVSKSIGASSCNQLEPPLAGHVRSIKVADGYDCRTFSLQNCFGAVNDYPDSVPNIQNKPPVSSIQCFKSQ